ncbi:hypothetical protein BC628DRAFT_27631 [Trametes gibbosa]|nr:hypothetical protein BC628DRAFT_27631 [Trametes gibbosa]
MRAPSVVWAATFFTREGPRRAGRPRPETYLRDRHAGLTVDIGPNFDPRGPEASTTPQGQGMAGRARDVDTTYATSLYTLSWTSTASGYPVRSPYRFIRCFSIVGDHDGGSCGLPFALRAVLHHAFLDRAGRGDCGPDACHCAYAVGGPFQVWF